MTQTAWVRVTVLVDLNPSTAFEVFTGEIDSWYRRGPHAFADPARAVGIRFEPRVGGRLIEVYDREQGEGRTMGTVTAWDPGRRVVFVDDRDTEVEVSFEAEGGQTRVRLEHRGLERLRPDLADRHGRFGWQLLIPWFSDYLRQPSDRNRRERIGR